MDTLHDRNYLSYHYNLNNIQGNQLCYNVSEFRLNEELKLHTALKARRKNLRHYPLQGSCSHRSNIYLQSPGLLYPELYKY